MAWTYTDDPAGVPRDAVRFALGDTDEAEQLCSDSEVAYALAQKGGNALLAAAFLADRLAARFSRDESVSVDGVSLGGAGRAAAFRTLAARLRAEAADAAAPPPGGAIAGAPRNGALVLTGVRKSDMAEADADTDRVRPAFTTEDPTEFLEREVIL